MGEKRQEVQLGVAMTDGRVSGDEERDIKVAKEVREGEVIVCDEWIC